MPIQLTDIPNSLDKSAFLVDRETKARCTGNVTFDLKIPKQNKSMLSQKGIIYF